MRWRSVSHFHRESAGVWNSRHRHFLVSRPTTFTVTSADSEIHMAAPQWVHWWSFIISLTLLCYTLQLTQQLRQRKFSHLVSHFFNQKYLSPSKLLHLLREHTMDVLSSSYHTSCHHREVAGRDFQEVAAPGCLHVGVIVQMKQTR